MGLDRLLHGLIVPLRPVERIARRKNVAGVNAHPERGGIAHKFKNRLELLEPMAQRRPLAGGRFEIDRHVQAAGLAMNLVDRLGRAPSPASSPEPM